MTRNHPPPDVLDGYRNATLPPEDLLEVDDHIAGCASCQESVAVGTSPGKVLRRFAESFGGDHLAYELMERHVDGLATADESARIDEHVRVCDACAQELEDLTSFRSAPRRAGWYWWTFAAAVAAVVFIAVLLSRNARNAVPPAAPTPVVTTTRPAQDRVVPPPAPTPADPFASLDPSLLPVVAALESGSLASAELLASLRPAPGQQRAAGDRPEAGPRLLEPLGTVVESDRPAFRWKRTGTRQSVTVQVFDRDYALVVESPRMQNDSWRPESALRRGANYRWQLTIHEENGEQATAPAPPDPPALFHVLSAKAFEELAAARRSGSMLEAGLICMREGLVSEGAQKLSEYAANHPPSARAARLAAKAVAIATR